MKGILNVNKPSGWTSFDVVNYLKKLLNVKHIGHLGTLDPMATGVLPVTIGSATKLFDLFLKKSKTYVAKFEFGHLTDSLDATGKIVEKTNKTPTIEEIKAILPKFIGEISQMPPLFSAKKINGKKAYDLARAGETVELKPSNVFIKNLEVLDYTNFVLTIKIECGAGTYIRSLARDIAKELNSLATMIELTRTEVGIFNLSDSINLKELTKEQILSKILPTDITFNHLPIITDETLVFRLINGQTIITNLTDGEYRIYRDNQFIALAKVEENKLKMTKYFN